MRQLRLLLVLTLCMLSAAPAVADEGIYDEVQADVGTVTDAVRVTLVKSGGQYAVRAVTGGGSAGSQSGCSWTLLFTPELDDASYGMSAGPKPHPDARFALLLCDGAIVRPIWVAPEDVVDLDALARDEALRYIEDVLVPDVGIGINPAAQGLVGLPSWFWVDGFTGSVTAPPIRAFGLTIEVRMSAGSVEWDFGDGETLVGDLGRAYPAESSVQHIHQRDGAFTVTAAIDLVPEYRVDGGPWLTLPNLQATATAPHAVEERQAVITDT